MVITHSLWAVVFCQMVDFCLYILSIKIKSATVSQVPSGKYFVSVLAEAEHVKIPHKNKNIGLDLGIKDL